MRRWLIIALFGLCTPMWGAISVVHSTLTCTTSPCTVTSTTAANSFIIGIQGSTVSSSSTVTLGSQSASFLACEYKNSGSLVCFFGVKSATGSQTTVTCSAGCGTIHSIIGVELSGADTTTFVDGGGVPCISASSNCNVNGAATVGQFFTPGYSNDAIIGLWNCSGTGTAINSSGITLTTGFPSGNAAAVGTVTSNAQIRIGSITNCGDQSGLIIGIKGAGATQTSTANLAYQDYSTLATSGTITLTVYVANVGDFVWLPVACTATCTTGTLTLGGSAATCTSTGVSDSNTGMVDNCYVIATAAGSQTLSWAPGGSPTNYQAVYYDFVLTGQTTIAHDGSDAFNNCASGCSQGTTITTPSITPTTGDLLLNAVTTAHHVTGFGGSWSCNEFLGSGETGSCFPVTTVNGFGYIQNAASGATAADVTILDNNDPFQSLISAWKYSSTAATGSITPAHSGIF